MDKPKKQIKRCPECNSDMLMETGTMYANYYHHDGEETLSNVFYETFDTAYWTCQECDNEFEEPIIEEVEQDA